ncbi:MAG: F0F1 ATP synthase subunit B [Saprospiraceae bacterium]|jgi:F-type H+-transporting ATPase subunit b|nr:F0F1 ATP synthase subunit B [Saprospiraceae bacterium]MBK7795620.1 F0F1 ATP synthase subunit B [Saprospiraceae bacterium]MBK8154139.1 F0F1 ATP synthase subunit B [Saprospiraceae bacterium]MBL0260731.1 F0F1 ATP synthase subunit B [Saprospiraceae bacterium]MBX7163000.1 F0F1 ATP synthase subunit B [Saprospiraceae bacterium]
MELLYIVAGLDFSVIKPDFGLLAWATIVFIIFWLGIGKLAFRPIVNALNSRALDIQNSLDAASRAKEDMKHLISENEKIAAEAREEKALIIKEAKEAGNQLVAEAKEKAKEEAHRILVNAKNEIENAKKAAIVDVKNQVGTLAIDIAEKIMRKELASNPPQQEYVKKLVDEIKLN